jgi:hypothetical protein
MLYSASGKQHITCKDIFWWMTDELKQISILVGQVLLPA